MEGIPWLGPLLFTAGTGLDIVSGGKYDPRTIGGDITGAVLAEGVDDIPGVGEIVGAITLQAAINHLEAMGLSYGEGQYARLFSGDIREQLNNNAENWKIVADNANPGAVYDSLGLTVFDYQTGNYGELPSDLLNTASTGVKFVASFPEMNVNMDATIVNNVLAAGDKLVQISPLPQSVKGVTNTMAGAGMGTVNFVANTVTNPGKALDQAKDFGSNLIHGFGVFGN